MKTLIDFSQDDIRWLDQHAAKIGKSRVDVIREAVSLYRAQRRDEEDIEQYFGLWAKHGSSEDGLDYQNRLRAEWDRVR